MTRTKIKTPEQRLKDKENTARRKAEIKDMSMFVKCVYEQAINAPGILDGSSDAGALFELKEIKRIVLASPPETTLGQTAILYLEHRLSIIKARN